VGKNYVGEEEIRKGKRRGEKQEFIWALSISR
jgi:hypothetical protein